MVCLYSDPKFYGDDRIVIELAALGHLNRLLNDAVLNSLEILNDTLYIIDTCLALENLEGRKRRKRQIYGAEQSNTNKLQRAIHSKY